MKLPELKLKPLIFIIIGILLIVCAVLVYTRPWQGKESVAWNLTLGGADGQQKVLTYDGIRSMPPSTGQGGFFSTAGIISGPYQVKGVSLIDLCNLVGGMTPSDAIMISGNDGYSSIFDYDQIMGGIITYDPKTMKETPHGELKFVLIYEQDGKSLTQDEGKPLRLAVIGKDNLLTEGNMWVKWVNKVTVMKVSQLQ